MFNLFCELHFWSQKDGIIVDSSDFGAFVYQDRKPPISCPVLEGKKLFCESRGVAFSLHNKRPKKLRESLAEFEEIFLETRVVRITWKCSSVIHAVFDNGHQSYVKINLLTGDPEDFIHDKYMVGRLLSNYISDVAINSHHAVFAYTDNHVMHANASKPLFKSSSTKKWNALDVKLNNIELAGPSGRRLDKTLSYNVTGDLILMWWKCGKDEVYPWSPQVKAEDRANVHIYLLNGVKFDLICYYRTKFDPITILFSSRHQNTIYTIQQRVTDEGEVILEWENALLVNKLLQNNYSLSLPLPTHVSAVALSPLEDKLLATCIDGSLIVADSYGNVTNRIRTNLIPSLASWHPDGALIFIGNNKGQIQWFDGALESVSCQIVNHDAHSLVLDVGCYFKYQPNLVSIHWNRRVGSPISIDEHNDFLLLHFEKGPLVMLKLLRPHDRRLSADAIVYQYLSLGAYNSALNLLHSVDWEFDSELAMSTLQSVVSFLVRQPLSPSTESAIEKALGYFLNPIRPIPESVASEVGDGIQDLARKFFHLLLRYQCFEKAFRLAIDLGKRDLFMDLYYYCKDVGNLVLSSAAWERAHEFSCSSCEEDSESSCDCSDSQSSSDDSVSTDVESESTQDLKEMIVPALPIMSPLESARNKVCYSSILRQHNYRRNPPKLSTIQGSLTLAKTEHPANPKKLEFDYSQPLNVGDYFRRDLKSIYLTEENGDDSFIEDGCVAHHPNIPSSRVPLQFNTDSTDPIFSGRFRQLESNKDALCSNVLSGISSDQTVGIPYSLKVANVRRQNNKEGSTINRGCSIHSHSNNISNEKVITNNFLQNTAIKLPHDSNNGPYDTVMWRNNNYRSQPEGESINGNLSEFEICDYNFAETPTEKPYETIQVSNSGGPNAHNNFCGFSFSTDLDALEFKSPFAQNLSRSVTTNAYPSQASDVADLSTKPSELPIIASAETEDGKIKVVHFGLV